MPQQIENGSKLATVPVFLTPNWQHHGMNWQHFSSLVASFGVCSGDRRGLSAKPAPAQAAEEATGSDKTGSGILATGTPGNFFVFPAVWVNSSIEFTASVMRSSAIPA